MIPDINYPASTQTFHIDKYGILYLNLHGESKYNLLTIERLNNYIDSISKICDNSAESILIDLRNIYGVISIEASCFNLLAKDMRLKTVCRKMAFITNSLPLTLKIDNYITKYHPNIRTRVFNYVEDGIDFCKNLKS